MILNLKNDATRIRVSNHNENEDPLNTRNLCRFIKWLFLSVRSGDHRRNWASDIASQFWLVGCFPSFTSKFWVQFYFKLKSFRNCLAILNSETKYFEILLKILYLSKKSWKLILEDGIVKVKCTLNLFWFRVGDFFVVFPLLFISTLFSNLILFEYIHCPLFELWLLFLDSAAEWFTSAWLFYNFPHFHYTS